MKFHMYVIDSRVQKKFHICGVDEFGNWQTADDSYFSRMHDELAPMALTSSQVRLATKQLKDCVGGKFRTIEVVPAV